MAISDILARIERESAEQAVALADAARAEAASLVARATAEADEHRRAVLEAAERDAAVEAATMLANTRLAARDELLAGKRERAERVLRRAADALAAMPDGEYLELIAREVARAAHGGETLSMAPADAARLAPLPSRLRDLGVDVVMGAATAPLERGVLLEGDRVRVEVSPASLVKDRADELLLVASAVLFGGTE